MWRAGAPRKPFGRIRAESRARCSERSKDAVSCPLGKLLDDGFGFEPVQIILDCPLLLLPEQPCLDGVLHFGEAADTFRLSRVHFGDVKSKDCAEDIAALIIFQREDDVFELLHHLAARDPAEVASISGAVGRSIRQLLEARSV